MTQIFPNGLSHQMSRDAIDFDYIGAFLFADPPAPPADPEDIIQVDQNEWEKLPGAPPPISGYRVADVQGIACWNCGHYTIVGDPDNDGDLDGICNLFESQAEGEFVCDRFVAHADMLRQSPHTSWQEDLQDIKTQDAMGPSVASVDYSDNSLLNEIYFSGADAVEEDDLVWKDILRTGEWSHTPTHQGIKKKRLQIVRDGESDPENGIISLAEILSNFEERVVPYVTVPLSDDKQDHKNITRLNTGLVRKLKLVDRDGTSYLRAGIGFTEPEIKEKVLSGTIPDCSAGVPYGVVRRRDNKLFKTVLDHVCLTHKPFIDGLGTFGLAAADSEAQAPDVESWELDDEVVPEPQSEPEQQPSDDPVEKPEAVSLTFQQQRTAIQNALIDQLRLSPGDYEVRDINPVSSIAIIAHPISNMRWEVPFKVTNNEETPVKVAQVDHWKVIEETQNDPVKLAASELTQIQKAQQLRGLRLAQPASKQGGIFMSTSAPSLEGVELSDEARSRVQSILDENARLKRQTHESKINDRISELEGLGLKDRPGALKFYRQIMLSDDEQPAVVLFSDDGTKSNEGLTAIQILDRFIESLKADGGVLLSDQHFESGNDNKPPATPEGENQSVEDRVKAANKALYGNEEGQVRRRYRRPAQSAS